MDWNVKKAQKGTNISPEGFSKEFNAVFLKKNGTENDKKRKLLSNFQVFKLFLSNFLDAPWIGMLKTFIKVGTRCQVVFIEEITSVYTRK